MKKIYKRYKTHLIFMINKLREGKEINTLQEVEMIRSNLEKEYKIKLDGEKLRCVENEVINLYFDKE